MTQIQAYWLVNKNTTVQKAKFHEGDINFKNSMSYIQVRKDIL